MVVTRGTLSKRLQDRVKGGVRNGWQQRSGNAANILFSQDFLLQKRNYRDIFAANASARRRTTVNDVTLPIREYRLTTAEIIYHLPDYPDVLQSFIWQKLDLAPEFPELRRFLDFWSRNIDGKLHSVKVAQARFAGRPRHRHLTASFLLH
jgi:uncharacterized protein Usg